MAGPERELENFNLDSSSSEEDDCPHQILKRMNDKDYSYECQRCHQQCQVDLGCRSSSSLSDGSNSSVEFEDSSNNRSVTTQTEPLVSSRLLDEFEYLGVLGRGGLGSVAKFRNKKDGRVYAIKKTKATERNEMEVKVLSTLQHENIVRYYTCWTEPDDSAFPKSSEENGSSENTPEEDESVDGSAVLYIQMEFCDNGTFREYIKSRKFVNDENLMWTLFRQLVEGINYFHNMNIIHRDLKPENLFLSSNGGVKIGDFGLARTTAQQTIIDGIQTESERLTIDCGGPIYTAPEMATGNYDTKFDIFSLGLIFFEMYREPFGSDMERLTELNKLRKSNFEALCNFQPNSVGIFVSWLLNHDPNERPSAKDVLLDPHMPAPLLNKLDDVVELVKAIFLNREKTPLYQHLMGICLAQTTRESDILNWIFGVTLRLHSISFDNLDKHPRIINRFIERCLESKAQYVQPEDIFPKLWSGEHYECIELKELAAILENQFAPSFIGHNGTHAVLPVNSYTPFARHVAKSFPKITALKRFCIQQVYRPTIYVPKTFSSCQPPEPSNTELAFDIVLPSSSTSENLRKADSEIIQVFEKFIFGDCQLSSDDVELWLNHRSLIEAVLIYFDVPVDQRSSTAKLLFDELQDFVNGRKRFDDLDLILKLLMNVKGSLDDIATHLYSLHGWIGSQSASLADEALWELRRLLVLPNNGLTYSIAFCLHQGLDYYDSHSGVLFTFMHRKKSWRLARGGRYDGLVHIFEKIKFNTTFGHPTMEHIFKINDRRAFPPREHYVVGGAVYLDALAEAVGDKKTFTRPGPGRFWMPDTEDEEEAERVERENREHRAGEEEADDRFADYVLAAAMADLETEERDLARASHSSSPVITIHQTDDGAYDFDYTDGSDVVKGEAVAVTAANGGEQDDERFLLDSDDLLPLPSESEDAGGDGGGDVLNF